jgi:hypothetical protein
MTTNSPKTEPKQPQAKDAESLRNIDEQHQETSKYKEIFGTRPIALPQPESAPDAPLEPPQPEVGQAAALQQTTEPPAVSSPLVPLDKFDKFEKSPQGFTPAQPESAANASSTPQAAPDIPKALPPSQKKRDSETAHKPGATQAAPTASPAKSKPVRKLGIIGGKGAGKSYLFQSMVYRTCDQGKSGALSYYLDRSAIRLRSSNYNVRDVEKEEDIALFIDEYQAWNRLGTTKYDEQRWYRLHLPYRTGWLGRSRRKLELEFFDGSGEDFLEKEFELIDDKHRQLWKDAYLDVATMVFCLPLWTVFPNGGLSPSDIDTRKRMLRGFNQVLANFRKLRERHNARHPVRCILALNMADDPRGALATLRERWLTPYMQNPEHYLKRLRLGKGVARYLANARKVSECLHREFDSHPDPLISGIPGRLDFDGGLPWIIPVSAIEGEILDGKQDHGLIPGSPPVPVHVELPLLVALCEHENALM